MKIAIIGYGKMGKVIEQIAKDRGHSIDLIIDKDNFDELNNKNLKKVDVAIEFSAPTSAFKNYVRCFEANVPVVSGTTGWLHKKAEVEEYCKKGAKFFYASNFSLGVNLFFKLNNYLAKLMEPYENYKVDTEEIHHTQKLDAPSGTAISLAEDILQNIPRLESWTNDVTNDEKKLPIVSKRIGSVPGIHTITYTSEQDEISIKHTAKGREGFALGAVLAAEFLVKQEAGWYNMSDLLKL